MGVIDDVFAKNSFYFRNSLVRANYKKFEKNIFEDISFLEKFFYNLLSNKNYELKNRYTHIDYIQDAEDDLRTNDYNFTKDEWILNGDTVIYSSFETIKATLEYDFEQERNFSYKDLSFEESIRHLCRFTSNIWQVHPFCEGNTRTTAVFMIKYLRTFGCNR